MTTCVFAYTGAAQTWTVAAGVTEATFDIYGAQGTGNASGDFAAGLGGRATAAIAVTPGDSIQVNVGGRGSPASGGFNGGGGGGPGHYGGGGASDIRIDGTALAHRVLVAGGGGAAASSTCAGGSGAGGDGGGVSGEPGAVPQTCTNGEAGGGGTQSTGGTAGEDATPGDFGVGGDGGGGVGGGGGGGWYGGGGGFIAGGGGGSGYGPVNTGDPSHDVVFETGVRSLDGLVTVTYTEPINQAPSAVIVADTTSGPVPLTVHFNGSLSSDPDPGDTLTYAWDLDGDGVFDDGDAPTAAFAYTAAGSYQAGLQVADNHGNSATASIVITAFAVNAAPDCSAVTATPGTLEPATRDQFKLITLSGATDPDGDALSFHIDAVSQDEPVSGSGVGDSTSPDAQLTAAGAGSNQVGVRAERNPMGNGRVYRIAYTVSDGHGGSCGGIAKVAVPRKKGQTAVDDGSTNSWNSFTGAKL